MKTKLCMFDLDGTLLDTIDDIANSMNRVLNGKNLPTRDLEWYKRKVGNGANDLAFDALPPGHGLSGEGVDEFARLYKEDYLRNCTVFAKPYEGIPELLQYLAGASIMVAVVTNKAQKSTDFLLKEYFGNIDFVAVYGDTPGRPIKPDPYAAGEILSLTGVLPGQAVFVGDAEVDILFAQNASLFSIGVSWGFRSREVLEEYGADAIVDRPEQIIGYL